jgi:hypothetical protein
MTVDIRSAATFHTALAAAARSPEIPESADAYGWLVGSWELDVKRYWAVDVSGQGLRGEVHAGWALEGRAVQDVWIMPCCGERAAPFDKKRNMYGTTLRLADHVEQPGGRTLRTTDRQAKRRGCRPVGSPRGRNADAMEIHRDHGGFLPLVGRVLGG